MVIKKRHGWLVGALQDAGYSQRDLAKAWKVDDAVVSRFISVGKPDLTPERQMLLSQMLGLSNDQLLGKLFANLTHPGRIIPLREQREHKTEELRSAAQAQLADAPQHHEVQEEIRRFVSRMQKLLPGLRVSINLTLE
jgi:hypothetical protein